MLKLKDNKKTKEKCMNNEKEIVWQKQFMTRRLDMQSSQISKEWWEWNGSWLHRKKNYLKNAFVKKRMTFIGEDHKGTKLTRENVNSYIWKMNRREWLKINRNKIIHCSLTNVTVKFRKLMKMLLNLRRLKNFLLRN